MNIDASFRYILNLLSEIRYEKGKISTKSKKKKIRAIEVKMNKLFQNVTTSTEIEFDNIIALAIAYFNLGFIYIYEQNDLNAGKDHLTRTMELLNGKELHRKTILIAIEVLIELSGVWKKLMQYENSYSLLDKAMELYINYTKEDEYPDPIDNENKIENTKVFLADLHLITLDKIEELYRFQPRDKHKFVIYIHNLLTEQLTEGEVLTENKMSWAKASADLSTYFLCHDRFIEARIHLAAASYIADTYYSLQILNEDNSESSENRVNYDKTFAHICKLWGIYGIKLLHSSKERLLQYKCDKSYKANDIKSESLAKSEEELMIPLVFIDIEKEIEICKSYNIDTYVSNLNDAQDVFTHILTWLNTAKTYYTVEKYFLNHMEIIIWLSEAYKYYAYFERSQNEQIKIIRQQINIMENVVSVIHSRCNKESQVEESQCIKRFYFKLAIAYSNLLDMRSEELDEIEEITDEMRMETRQLLKNIIDNFNLFEKI